MKRFLLSRLQERARVRPFVYLEEVLKHARVFGDTVEMEDAAYYAMLTKYRRREVNHSHVARTKAEISACLAICAACRNFNQQKGTCGLYRNCRCFENKLLHGAPCPIGQWPLSTNQHEDKYHENIHRTDST